MSKLNTKKSHTRHRNRRKKTAAGALRFRALRTAVTVMMLLGGFAGGLSSYAEPAARVLAYATNVNHAGLLASSNQQRAANGLAGFGMDGRLNSAAQAKANDMVAKDYWAHTSPDGRQPWDFIIAAGYSYSRAGENLAYGALTSEQTVQAWMNSPGHRANILNSGFTQVGFGFANSANYQGSGPQTIVVAMYAAPYGTPTPAPNPAPTQTQPLQATQDDTSPPAQEQNDEQHRSDQDTADTDREDGLSGAVPTRIDQDGNTSVAPVEQAQTVRRISVVTGNYAPWVVGAVIMAGILSVGAFLYRHSRAWHRLIIKGEDYIVHHPIVDAAAVMTVVVVAVLLQSVGKVL